MEQAKTLNVAMVGGGPGCKAIMDIIFAKRLRQLRMKLIGVACTNPKAVGYRYAQEKDIYTAADYRDLYKLKGLNMIIELTGREEVANEISRTKPDSVRFMDHVAARLFWDVFHVEEQVVAERKGSEEALRKSEEKYKTLIESSLTGIFIHQDGKYVFVNDRFAEIHGYEPGELLGKESLSLVHPDEREALREIASKRLDGGDVPERYEIRRLAKDGKTIWCEMMATRIEYGVKPAIMGNIIDISERKQAEEALRDSEERYRTVLEASPDPVVVYDMEGKGLYINPVFTRLFGWALEELLGRRIDYVPDENRPETKMMIDKVLAGESFSGVESRRYTKDGNILDVDISAAVYLDRDGIPVGSIHILRDITDRKLVEEALQRAHRELEIRVEKRTVELSRSNVLLKQEIAERKRGEKEILKSKAMLQGVFDGISDPLIMLDMNLIVRMLNRPAAEYYQVQSQDVIGKACHQAFQGRPGPCEGCNIPSAILRGRSLTFERKGFTDPDRLEQVVIYPVKQKDSQAGSAIIRISDITAARFMERQLIRSEKLASLGLLVSGVAHEINNPLAIINEKAGLMKDLLGFSDEFEHREKFLNLLNSIFNSVDRSRVVTKRLLGFSKSVDISTEDIHLDRLLQEVLGFLEREAFHRSINVSLNSPPDLPTLESDKGQLQQVFLNIIKNAFEAVEDEGNVSVVTRLKGLDTVQVIITDDGRGMSPEQLKYVFEPFYTSGKASGTGLGLFITRGIVTKNLGGKITVQSEEGKGTTFTVELPTKRRKVTN